MSDWDRYAAQEYELLVAEEGGDTQGWVKGRNPNFNLFPLLKLCATLYSIWVPIVFLS